MLEVNSKNKINSACEAEKNLRQDKKQQQERLQQRITAVRRHIDQVYVGKLDSKIYEDFWQRKTSEWQQEEQQIQMAMQGLDQASADQLLNVKRALELANKAYFLYVTQKPAGIWQWRRPRRSALLGLWGCSSGVGGGGGCGIDHPPMLAPNESVSFQYLLTDYRLRAGNYVLRANGIAGVRWKYYPDRRPNTSPTPPPQHKEGDPFLGAAFDISLPINVTSANQEELQSAYAPYIVDAESPSAGAAEMRRARGAITEMAPEFLEKTIAGFASGPTPTADLAVKGLGQIDSAESRVDLIRLYDKSTDLMLRNEIIHALASFSDARSIAVLCRTAARKKHGDR